MFLAEKYRARIRRQEKAVLDAHDALKSTSAYGPTLSEVKKQIGGRRILRGNLWRVSKRLNEQGLAVVTWHPGVSMIGKNTITGHYRLKRVGVSAETSIK